MRHSGIPTANTGIKGNDTAIKIPKEEYKMGLSTCKHNLHGRMLWPKGTTPLKVSALKAKLLPHWKTLGQWGVTSLGKGYYEFSFSSLEDAQSVRSIGSWNLNPGILKLFAWSNDLCPSSQQNFSAQVWLRIYGLSQEYWRPKILFAIASSVGTPICTDQATSKSRFDREFGHFARVLVDMDLRIEPKYRVLVEKEGFAFFVDLDYDNLPRFCTFCNCIGHSQSQCKKEKAIADQHKQKVQKKNPMQGQKQDYVIAKDNRQKNNTEKEAPAAVNLEENEQHNRQEVANNEVDGLAQNIQDDNFVTTENVDDNESNDSEFVDATQINNEEVGDSENLTEVNQLTTPQAAQNLQNLAESEKTPTHEIIARDMQFLKASWANLADQQLEDECNEELQRQATDIE